MLPVVSLPLSLGINNFPESVPSKGFRVQDLNTVSLSYPRFLFRQPVRRTPRLAHNAVSMDSIRLVKITGDGSRLTDGTGRAACLAAAHRVI
ncbi:unnamed protein product [Boreogadus saida]